MKYSGPSSLPATNDRHLRMSFEARDNYCNIVHGPMVGFRMDGPYYNDRHFCTCDVTTCGSGLATSQVPDEATRNIMLSGQP